MTAEERYRLTSNGEMLGTNDLKALVWDILMQEGLNSDIVNFKEEAVHINVLNKLVRAIYTVGYNDGREHRAILLGKKRRAEREGDKKIRQNMLAKSIKKTTYVN